MEKKNDLENYIYMIKIWTRASNILLPSSWKLFLCGIIVENGNP